MDKNMKEHEMIDEEVLKEPIELRKVKRSIQAKLLVQEAESIVQGCNAQTVSSKLLLESDLHEYETAEASLNNAGLEDCILLLENLGYTDFSNEESVEEEVLDFETVDKISTFEVKNIQSGRFTAFIYGILGAIIFAIALVYLATEQLGITLDISHIPSYEILIDIASWFSIAVGLEKSFYTGLAILSASSLAIMVLIYVLRVNIRASSNLHFAEIQLEEVQVYQTAQGLSKWEMGRVEEHMRETLVTFKLYEVVFREQNMKLERILYIEGAKMQENEYHSKSLIEMKETKKLIEVIQKFMSIPMSEEGKLLEQSVRHLELLKLNINKVLDRFYG